MSVLEREPTVSVLVVEDERELLEEVVTFLAARGMEVRGAADARSFWTQFEERRPDVVVLDVGLPGEDGRSIAAAVRERDPSLGIVMATARGTVRDRVSGYETGADVYLVKPVDLRELAAAIRATRRHRPQADPAETPPAWELDLVSWQLVSPAGNPIQLTRAEIQILQCLAETPGTPISRLDIGLRMGKSDALQDHRYIDQSIRRLRRKIKAQTGDDAPIGSAHGKGYYFSQPISKDHTG
ncbi:response regulator transcription factor [Nisaea sp.]|uniref:response regulator transcription factor n=1 Tax=Nisaea sp. TaxID=2024842 RepID=UPI003B52A032